MNKIITFAALVCLISSTSLAKEPYRAPSGGDKGAYYVLKKKEIGNGEFHVLASRIGKGNAYTDFTELKINCKIKQYFELAGGEEDGAKDKPTIELKDWSKQSKWTSLVVGSSKYDLVEYICKKKKIIH